MIESLNTFADFIADFPYEPGWTETSAIALPGRDVAALLADGLGKRGFAVQKSDVRWFPSYERPGYLKDRDADSRPIRQHKTAM